MIARMPDRAPHPADNEQAASAPSGAARTDLKRRLAALEVRAPEGKAASPNAKRVSGRTYRFEANDEKLQSAALSFRGGRCTAVMQQADGERRVECGSGEWIKGSLPLGDRASSPVAARGAWLDDDTYSMRVCFYETPYVQTVTWKFAGDQVTRTSKMNVGFGPTERPPLVGHST
jgi:hypothetical protein